jgi:hypothetical protein
MSVDWLSWSNPVSIWWGCLLLVSSINVILWLAVARHLLKKNLRLEVLACLSAVYVFGCAFRAVLPRADVQRICLFDNWLSSALVGRSIATVAEVCFAAQWAVVLYCLADSAQSGTVRKIAKGIVPLIILAECYSWYAVITTDYLGNTVENSLWAATFLLIGAGLVVLLDKFEGVIQFAIRSALLGIVGYVAFMVMVDVPMYFERWQADAASGKELLGFDSRIAGRGRAVDCHSQPRALGGRNYLDDALLQLGGMGKPGALRVRPGKKRAAPLPEADCTAHSGVTRLSTNLGSC